MRDCLQIDERTVITRSAHLMTAPVHDETVMMDPDNGRFYGLDDIGSEIWRRLETPRRFGDLVDGLAADFAAERSVIAEDVRGLLAGMAACGVVRIG